MKNKLIAIIFISAFFSIFKQQITLAETSGFQLQIDKTQCQFGIEEEQLYPIAYSYLKDNNLPVLSKDNQSSNTYTKVNIRCPKESEFISLLFDIELVQAAQINNNKIEAITYTDRLSTIAYPQDFNRIEQEGLALILDNLIYNWESIK